MTKKDFTPTENNDRERAGAEDLRQRHEETNPFPEEAEGIGEVDVKNAHATGDGSFGRNEGSLPDEEQAGPKEDNGY